MYTLIILMPLYACGAAASWTLPPVIAEHKNAQLIPRFDECRLNELVGEYLGYGDVAEAVSCINEHIAWYHDESKQRLQEQLVPNGHIVDYGAKPSTVLLQGMRPTERLAYFDLAGTALLTIDDTKKTKRFWKVDTGVLSAKLKRASCFTPHAVRKREPSFNRKQASLRDPESGLVVYQGEALSVEQISLTYDTLHEERDKRLDGIAGKYPLMHLINRHTELSMGPPRLAYGGRYCVSLDGRIAAKSGEETGCVYTWPKRTEKPLAKSSMLAIALAIKGQEGWVRL